MMDDKYETKESTVYIYTEGNGSIWVALGIQKDKRICEEKYHHNPFMSLEDVRKMYERMQKLDRIKTKDTFEYIIDVVLEEDPDHVRCWRLNEHDGDCRKQSRPTVIPNIFLKVCGK